MKDKVVIITGSSMGIGKTLAYEMAKLGAKVVLNGRNKEKLERTAEEFNNLQLTSLPVCADVSKFEDCQRLINRTIQHFGRLDILVNNAGMAMKGEVQDLSPIVIQNIFKINVWGSIFPTQLALPFLKKTKGSVVFINSLAGVHGIPNFSIYSASKMALTGFYEALKIEQKKSGIHFGSAYLGFTQNDPDKVIFSANGEIIPQPKNSNIKPDSQEWVAKRIIRLIQKKQSKVFFGNYGKALNIINRFSPPIIHRILTRNYFKI